MAKTLRQLPIRAGLFELDDNNDFMPVSCCVTQFDIESNRDICPCIEIEIEYDDIAFELNENNDITTRE